MYNIIIFNSKFEQKSIIENISFADTYIKRLFGLIGKIKFNGLIFKQKYSNKISGSIHTYFMKTTIELLYINDKMEIQEIVTLTPWKLYIPQKKNIQYIIELPEHTVQEQNIHMGDKIMIKKK